MGVNFSFRTPRRTNVAKAANTSDKVYSERYEDEDVDCCIVDSAKANPMEDTSSMSCVLVDKVDKSRAVVTSCFKLLAWRAIW